MPCLSDVEYTFGYVKNAATGLCLTIDQTVGFFEVRPAGSLGCAKAIRENGTHVLAHAWL